MLSLGAGFSGLSFAWWLSTLGTSVCMLGIQYLLLKTHRARKILPVELVPSQPELYAAVACFWLAYLGSIKTVVHGARGFVWILSQFELEGKDGLLRDFDVAAIFHNASDSHFSDSKIAFQLLNCVILTWQIHQLILLVLDTTIPFVKNLYQTPRITIKSLCARIHNVFAFLQLLTIGHPSTPSPGPFKFCVEDDSSRSTTQKIRLQRTQNSSPKKGRTLSWNLTVDKEALDEMKETLGPPGGFGELGFCVAKDEVRFEAMGVGTSFGLVFGVERENGDSVSVGRTRPGTKVRRKTK